MATRESFISLADKMLNASFKAFNRPVTFEQESQTSDGQGGHASTWSNFASVNVFIFPMKAQEKIQAGRLITDQMFNIHLKPIDGLDTKMKMIYNSEDYQIRSIENIAESDIWLKVTAEKGVAQ